MDRAGDTVRDLEGGRERGSERNRDIQRGKHRGLKTCRKSIVYQSKTLLGNIPHQESDVYRDLALSHNLAFKSERIISLVSDPKLYCTANYSSKLFQLVTMCISFLRPAQCDPT